MNNWKINKTVDLARGIDGIEVWPHALLVTGDKNAHEWNVTVMDNGKAASLDGIIQAYFVRSDGATVTAAGSVAGNVATVTLPEACYAYEGDLSAVMQLIQDDASVTLSALLLRVRQITTDVIIDPGTEIPSLDDLLAQIEKLKQATKDANAATTNANQAATNVENRVNEAISAAEGRIDTAVQSAETATSKADASAAKADTATANANTATNRANAAAEEAEKIVVEKNIATKDYVTEQIDGIEIGGRNYIRNSDFSNGANGWMNWGSPTTREIISDGNKNWAHIVSNDKWQGYCQRNDIVISGYSRCTISALVKGGANDQEITIGVHFCRDTMATDIISQEWNYWTIGTNEQIVSITLDIPAETKCVNLMIGEAKDGATYDVYYTNVKFELGEKATDWSPAPEDLDSKIDAIEIGGTNYILGSDFRDYKSSRMYPGVISVNGDVLTYSNDGGTVDQYIEAALDLGDNFKKSVPGKQICVSFEYKLENPLEAIQGEREVTVEIEIAIRRKDTSRSEYFGLGYRMRYEIHTPIEEVYPVSNVWRKKYAVYDVSEYEIDDNCQTRFVFTNIKGSISFRHPKVEVGNKPTDWSPAPENVSPRLAGITYDCYGRNLNEIFGTPDNLRNCLYNEIYNQIAVGDYWPVTLNGTFRDYGYYSVPHGVPCFTNPECTTGQTTVAENPVAKASYYSDTVVRWVNNSGTWYAKIADCLDYFEMNYNNVIVNLEVAAINPYCYYGDKGQLVGFRPHIVFISRDCLPIWTHMRKGNTKWDDPSANNPWLGSAMFRTLNDKEHGIINLLSQTEIGPYIYAGENDNGMRAMMERKGVSDKNATNNDWNDRGKLFLPTEYEVFGCNIWSSKYWNAGLYKQFEIFAGSNRHVIKKQGDGASRTAWWLQSSAEDSDFLFTGVDTYGNPGRGDAGAHERSAPICFVFSS